MKEFRKILNVPNIITAVRLAGTIMMLFVQPLSRTFYLVFTIAGISDVLDGYAARKLNQITEFGSKLDSICDLFFYTVMMIKIYPILLQVLPQSVWVFVRVIIIIRVLMYGFVAIMFRKFASEHTVLNKITGLLFFLIPYFVKTSWFTWYALLICIIAMTAALTEWTIHIRKMKNSKQDVEV